MVDLIAGFKYVQCCNVAPECVSFAKGYDVNLSGTWIALVEVIMRKLSYVLLLHLRYCKIDN